MLIENVHISEAVGLDGVVIQCGTVEVFGKNESHIFGIDVMNEFSVSRSAFIVEFERTPLIDQSRLAFVAVAVSEFHNSVFAEFYFPAIKVIVFGIFAEIREFGIIPVAVGGVNVQINRCPELNVGKNFITPFVVGKIVTLYGIIDSLTFIFAVTRTIPARIVSYVDEFVRNVADRRG